MGKGIEAVQICYAFGKWLRNCRRERGVSLRELGRIARANYSYIARLEHGVHAAPSRDMVIRLARALRASRLEALLAAGYAPYPEEFGVAGHPAEDLVAQQPGELHKDHGRAGGDGDQKPRDS